jgi:hypothetical protein
VHGLDAQPGHRLCVAERDWLRVAQRVQAPGKDDGRILGRDE